MSNADWIKIRVCLPDEPEVIAISNECGISEDEVVGKLVRLWGWADQHLSRNGHAQSVTRNWLDRYVRRDGFADAMVTAGWLRIADDGIEFPDFDKHNTQTGKERALALRRKHRERESESRSCHAPTVTKTGQKRDQSKSKSESKEKECVSRETPAASAAVKTGGEKPKRTRHTYSKAFQAFWTAYPPRRRRDKSEAAEKFRIAVDSLTAEHGSRKAAEQYLIQRASEYAGSHAGQNYSKMPVTWLNKGCWDDSPEAWENWRADEEGTDRKHPTAFEENSILEESRKRQRRAAK